MVGNNLEAEAVAQVPKAKDAEDALFQIGSHKGVHIESETSDAQVAHEHSDFLFQCVGEEEAGFDDAGSSAGGAGFINFDVHGGSHSLSRDLHEPEF